LRKGNSIERRKTQGVGGSALAAGCRIWEGAVSLNNDSLSFIRAGFFIFVGIFAEAAGKQLGEKRSPANKHSSHSRKKQGEIRAGKVCRILRNKWQHAVFEVKT
jgi:hypothetical protein